MLSNRPRNHSGGGLPAITLRQKLSLRLGGMMRAVIEPSDVGAHCLLEVAAYLLVQPIQISLGIEAPANARLIAHYNQAIARVLQLPQRRRHPRQKLKLRPGADVTMINVDDPVTIEEGGGAHRTE